MNIGNPTAVRVGTVAAAAAFAVLGLAPLASAQTDSAATPHGYVPPAVQHDNGHRVAVTPGATGANKLNFEQQTQKNDQWCWAAEGSSIEQFLGASTTQEQFCAAGLNSSVGNCPNKAGEGDDIVRGFQKTGFQVKDVQGSVSFNDIKAQIDGNTPVMAGISWTSGGGHAQAIYGYDESNKSIDIGDPWPSSQRYKTTPYNSYLKNNRSTWVESWTNIHK